ncbi:MAG: hypothetical protein A3C43_01420 [Candidatus Schekmanbacteria bacterium RIFCSPHIGHO2_02_FULL_38_11]|uniref:Uncharacterized protein n=1 Tax=Candidatus Schekmanbacteria bacterium RIFCSPLOWO2_12_FULL_38_15 TaxID=1817883 RepID=A0A1F7SNI2_9BACT|nr:MAG: hypothetical protein A2043_10495 [Candidatus Schekmanbacteria bacterium GWA2_38_9]OGL49778.1 MAG: hypothetical protein A3C43_01420 [Candidatus Schekmanbacteria bacterium RIFCSPHIGHO2_02_FULL_38_11]OGL55331.1 MAG: hypothetical protein A3G31_04835 [Candidatus Schekmanbacteria bacterium RIFCSPLOWO2_12_FULL_38_15]
MPARETEIISEEEIAEIVGRGVFEDIKKAKNNLNTILNSFSSIPFSEEELSQFLKAIAQSPDPDMALNNLERLFSAAKRKREIASYLFSDINAFSSVIKVFGTSQFLSNIILNNPDYLKKVLNAETLKSEKDVDVMLKEMDVDEDNLTQDAVTEKLRTFKNREFLRIGARDILGIAPLPVITEEISSLASACLEAACRFAEKTLRKTYGIPYCRAKNGELKESRFCIIGLGKLGGWELNYSSDIDIIYIYSTDEGETSGVESNGKEKNKITLHEYYTKIAEIINKLISSSTEQGNVFRLDLRLRPEGRSGDMVNSLRSMEIYYESWGQTWERQMLLKAKPVAGDMELGRDFSELVKPFIYRKHLDFQAIQEIKEMKEKINLSVSSRGEMLNDVKLGYGGIREVEFFIQALQLIYGGRDEKIIDANTLKALKKLCENKYISADEHTTLVKGYTFLRMVEHRIQLLEGRQEHSFPSEEKKLKKFARKVGYFPEREADEKERFLNDYKFFTNEIRKIFDKLFYGSAQQKEKEKKDEDFNVLWNDIISEEDAIKVLNSMGFSEAQTAYKNLKLLRDGKPFSHFLEKSKELLREAAPLLFREIAKTPDPDMALNSLEKFISTSSAPNLTVSLLAESSGARDILLDLFGTSKFISDILIRHPEYIDLIQEADFLERRKSISEIENELLISLGKKEGWGEKLDLLRKFRTEGILRIGLMDILKGLALEDTTKEISKLAKACLKGACAISYEELKKEFGVPYETDHNGEKKESEFAIFGLGKLGGEEINYSSDLDVIFVYSGEGETEPQKSPQKKITNQEFFSKLSIKILQAMNEMREDGLVFRIDSRLRPSGSSGYIAQSIKSYENYFKARLQLWERQTLVKIKFLTGSRLIEKDFIPMVHRVVFDEEFTSGMAAEIDKMRKRMEKELAREDTDTFHLKFGEGGIVDIEFVAQALQLKYGRKEKGVRNANTLDALKKLEECGFIEKKDYMDLAESYKFLRMVENRLRIVQDKPLNILLKSPEKVVKLAKRMGYQESEKESAGVQLLKDYELYTEKVREVYNRYFGILCSDS